MRAKKKAERWYIPLARSLTTILKTLEKVSSAPIMERMERNIISKKSRPRVFWASARVSFWPFWSQNRPVVQNMRQKGVFKSENIYS
jgi:hypothetical protein